MNLLFKVMNENRLKVNLPNVIKRIAQEFKIRFGSLKFREISKQEYDSLPEKDPNTIYFLKY